MPEPFFSIICPSYNRAEMLREAVNSVLNQDFEDWELIVVDDGSTDSTESVIKSFQDERIQYHFQENAERNIARNRGIDLSRASFVCFLDSDDLFLSNHLSQFKKNIDSNPKASFFFNPFERTGPYSQEFRLKAKSRTAFIKELCWENVLAPISMCIARRHLSRHRFPNNRTFLVGEDQFLALNLLSEMDLIVGSSISAELRGHEGRSMAMVSSDSVLVSIKEMMEGLKSNPSFMSEQGSSLNVLEASCTSLAALSASLEGNRSIAWKLLRRALFLNRKEFRRKRNYATLKHLLFA